MRFSIVPCLLLLISGTFASAQENLHLDPRISESLEAVQPDEQTLIARADELKPEYRNHLAYLYARLNKPKLAAPLAEAALREEPDDKRLLLAMASMYLALRDAPKTLAYAKRILEHYPEDRDGKYFLAAGEQIANNPAEARQILLEMKREHEGPAPYPYEVDLASAASQSGDWHLAIESYITILRDYELSQELHAEVRRALDNLYRQHNPQARAEFNQIDYGSGATLSFTGQYSHPLTQRTRLGVEVGHHINRFDGDAIFQEQTENYSEGLLRLEHLFNRLYETEIWGGAFADNARAGIKVMRRLDNDSKIGASYDHARPSDDSQSVRYLKGREHRAGAHLELDLPHNYTLFANAYARQTHVEAGKLGHGTGADWQLSYPIHYLDMEIFLSWRGAYSQFNANSNNLGLIADLPFRSPLSLTPGAVNNIVSERIHREGMGLLLIRNFENTWVLDVSMGLDYYFYLDQFAWDSGIGLLYRPRKSIEVSGRLIYSSTDNTGNQNAENIQFALAVRKIF